MTSKAAKAAADRAYRTRHKAKIAASDKAYRVAHRSEILTTTKAYYAAHKAKIVAKKKAYYAAHKTEKAAYHAAHKVEYEAYRREHKAEIAVRRRAYYVAHKIEKAAWQKAYQRAHPDKTADIAQRHRARKRKAAIENVRRAVVFARDGGRCHICHKKVNPKRWHLDHIIPLSKGGAHSYQNVAVSHPTCNQQKNDRRGFQLRLLP